jgi:hypothetical protein
MKEKIGHALSVFMGFFAIMNPIADTPIFLGLTAEDSAETRKRVAAKALVTTFALMLLFCLLGKLIFELLGITLPAFRITGGVLVALIGYQMHHGEQSRWEPRIPGCDAVNSPTCSWPTHPLGEAQSVIEMIKNLPIYCTARVLHLLFVGPAAAQYADDPKVTQGVLTGRPYSPCANRAFPTNVYFGDTQVHTGLSADAGGSGTHLMPRDAYRFALGEQVTSNTGQPVKLERAQCGARRLKLKIGAQVHLSPRKGVDIVLREGSQERPKGQLLPCS